jgi:D-arabinose 1-dehydrogenase-like Zn-dependent alcohol dehydrogenase
LITAAKPANLSFEQAATVPIAGTTALQAVRDAGNVRAGQSVLIHAGADANRVFQKGKRSNEIELKGRQQSVHF